MRHAVYGLFTYFEFIGLGVLFLPALALAAARHRNDAVPRVPGRWMRRFGRTSARLTPLWHFRIDGTPPPDIGSRAYVVVANHESDADPFLLCGLPWDMRWVAKESLFRARSSAG